MKKTPLYVAIFALGGLSLAAGSVTAQGSRPPQPDFAAMAQALDVPQNALTSCLGKPPQNGQRPAKPDASKVASCLNEAGHSVSAKAVDKALAVGGPKRG